MKSEKIYTALFKKYDRKPVDCFDNVYYSKIFETDFLVISKSDFCTEIEIKVSRSDFLADFKKRYRGRIGLTKHEKIQSGAYGLKHFYFAAPEGMLTLDDIPSYCGLMEVSEYGDVTIVKKAPTLPKAKKIAPEAKRKIFYNMYYRYLKFKKKKYEDEN